MQEYWKPQNANSIIDRSILRDVMRDMGMCWPEPVEEQVPGIAVPHQQEEGEPWMHTQTADELAFYSCGVMWPNKKVYDEYWRRVQNGAGTTK